MKISERVDNRTHVPIEILIDKPPFPDDMKIELTSRCNLYCKHCAVNKRLRPQGDMDWKIYTILIDACKYLQVKNVGLFLLGESFMLRNLSGYIKYAKEKEIEYVYLTTNGTLCNKENMQAVMNAGLDSLKFSLNMNEYKNIVIENIKWIAKNRNNKINLCVSCVWDENHKDELLNLEKEMKEVVGDFYFLPMYNQAGHVKALQTGNVGRMCNPVNNVPCWELFNTTRITWDGYMAICSFPHTDEYKIGNIKALTLMNLWHSDKFVEIRKSHLENKLFGVCDRCINGGSY